MFVITDRKMRKEERRQHSASHMSSSQPSMTCDSDPISYKDNKVQQGVACSRGHSHKVRTRSFNSHSGLAESRGSVFYCYACHLPVSAEEVSQEALKGFLSNQLLGTTCVRYKEHPPWGP